MSWCHAGQAELVGLPRSESGAAFASRARHAAAALLPPIASIYIGAGAAIRSNNELERLRSAPPCGVEPSGSAIRRAILELF